MSHPMQLIPYIVSQQKTLCNSVHVSMIVVWTRPHGQAILLENCSVKRTGPSAFCQFSQIIAGHATIRPCWSMLVYLESRYDSVTSQVTIMTRRPMGYRLVDRSWAGLYILEDMHPHLKER
jgi:hypothetical protein